jgi:hypothetical protein
VGESSPVFTAPAKCATSTHSRRCGGSCSPLDWPRALQLGRKLEVYLVRGCPYRCTFCMERSKTGYQWRAYSPQRAVAERERLSTFTDLSQWVINIADPLFGFQRCWRREVLEGIIEKACYPWNIGH